MTILRKLLKPFFKYLIFYFAKQRNRNAKEALSHCSSIDDLWNISKNYFEPTQIENEILPFLRYCKESKPITICEIGVERGGTNFLLTNFSSSVKTILGVDVILKNGSFLKFLSNGKAKYVEGFSNHPATVAKIKRLLNNSSIDLLFIDGDHSYEGVKRDFQLYSPLVSRNGIIAFHDIVQDHAIRFGIDTSSCSGGVPTFWKEIKQEYRHKEFVNSPGQDGFGIGLIHI